MLYVVCAGITLKDHFHPQLVEPTDVEGQLCLPSQALLQLSAVGDLALLTGHTCLSYRCSQRGEQVEPGGASLEVVAAAVSNGGRKWWLYGNTGAGEGQMSVGVHETCYNMQVCCVTLRPQSSFRYPCPASLKWGILLRTL